MNEQKRLGNRITDIVLYAVQVILGAYIPLIVTFPLAMVLDAGFNLLKWRSAQRMTGEPLFILQIVAAIFIALLYDRQTRRSPSTLVWIPTAVNLLWGVFTWNKYPSQINYWSDVWNNYFGTQCGGSECLYELAVTAPFYCSVAYSLAGLLLRSKRRFVEPGDRRNDSRLIG